MMIKKKKKKMVVVKCCHATLQSADSTETDNDDVPYLTEYLNTLNTGGLPLAGLALKPGVPVMLLHTLGPTQGMWNEKCLMVTGIRSSGVKCQMLSVDWKFAGKSVLIPQITLTYSSLPGDAQLVVGRCQRLSSILFRGVFNL
jgi:hypothetical protein